MTSPTSPLLERLAQFLETRPTDSFVRYGYAMELAKLGRGHEAAEAFLSLLKDDPEYVPAYLQAGTVLAREGREAEARDIFRRGIGAASGKGDEHAREELSAALQQLGS